MDFNYFDVSIASLILILGIKGFINGVIKELFGFFGLVGGVYFASRLADTAGEFIETHFIALQNPSLLKLIGFLSVLVLIWLGVMLLGSIFSKLTEASGLGFLNRLFGFVVGGGKYFLIFALIVTALSNVTLVKDNIGKYVKDSLLYPILLEAGTSLIKIDTSSLGVSFEDINRTLNQETNATPLNGDSVAY